MRPITYQDIVNLHPCNLHHPHKYISEDWEGSIISLLELPNVAPTEKLWVARMMLSPKILRLFAVDCARRALSRVSNPDPLSIAACDVAEKYARGEATIEELMAARKDAADAAAYAAAAYVAYATDATADAAAYASAAAYVAYATDATADAAAYASAAAAADAFYADDAAAYAAAAYAGYKHKREQTLQIMRLIIIIEQEGHD